MVIATHDLNLAAALCETVVLLKQGQVLAQGPINDTLTASNIRALYDVDADVHFHEQAGHPGTSAPGECALQRTYLKGGNPFSSEDTPDGAICHALLSSRE